ncbi:DUF1285 domain-containing protein [Haliea sp. E17]|uniref:DUF1285 domain-containing protein n=1 Tax=Haliea sp. E17 TaxID=3401576 RepID=UPI003AAEDD3B
MADPLEQIEQQMQRKRDFDSPPLHLWHPELSGDIDIQIAADGSWYHEGTAIERESLRNLFASILRREEDGEYYLVTPVEKWRIQVQLHPLLVTDVSSRDGYLQATLNTGKTVTISPDHPLQPEPSLEGVAVLSLWHGLTALFSRSAWYRLVELADEDNRVHSGDYSYSLA